MVKRTRSDSSKNNCALQLAITLLGECVLIAEWGRISSRVQERVCPSPAQAALAKRQAAKIRHGKLVTSA